MFEGSITVFTLQNPLVDVNGVLVENLAFGGGESGVAFGGEGGGGEFGIAFGAFKMILEQVLLQVPRQLGATEESLAAIQAAKGI